METFRDNRGDESLCCREHTIRTIEQIPRLRLISKPAHDDHPIHHRSVFCLQPFLSQGKDCPSLLVLLPGKCATDYKDEDENPPAVVHGAKLCAYQIQRWKGDEVGFREVGRQGCH
ncbi:hypothetical protein PVAG01_05312 [Phlyctema vagabunda]|uniref:Uncharacterized protein n=1 Tax=Phlyctema vagabunda TaxID=108571 RepID=A0ABR4PJS9_9HELO